MTSDQAISICIFLDDYLDFRSSSSSLFFSFTSIVRSLEFEDPPYGQSVYDIEMPKRNYYQHVWRQIHMNMPREQQGKRAEKLSKVRANAYYRLG
ncbi:unnamed protein product, partial [Mesorhabditis belari]|uniref:Uncharacterized protein n=1 Tax=Mesorhabditis belari TaxID=2138241 RepID=A0AAF3F4I3_9BILA